MRFFFPDSSDLIDPSFNFDAETRSDNRVRHRDDLYAHEVFRTAPYDGILLSKALIDAGRYTVAQRQRFFRSGIRRFFRLDERNYGKRIEAMGDCGAFSYVRDEVPRYSVEDIVAFYEDCGFDSGLSVDHVILGYSPQLDECFPGSDFVPAEYRLRQDLTVDLASKFWDFHRSTRCRFEPIGVAQGWSPHSYARAVADLQRIGYRRIAVGGIVGLKNDEVLACLRTIDGIREPQTQLHLLGIARCEHVGEFSRFGVTSFDSTSPLKQAFKDESDNYYTLDRTYPAIRVPQVEGNPKLNRLIKAGKIDQKRALHLERRCMNLLAEYDHGTASLGETLETLLAYEEICDGGSPVHEEAYREVLSVCPWRNCACEICSALGIHVILFRGAERNRRRGFHNVFVVGERLRLATPSRSDDPRPVPASADTTPSAEGGFE